MNRTIIYSQEQPRSFDFVQWEHDVLVGLGFTIQDILDSTTTVLSGFAATQTTVASLTINMAAGRVYQQASADAVAVGAITQDLTQIIQQGFYAAAQITLSTAGISAGQSRWALIEAQFSQTDVVRTGDPNGGIPPFYNAANPSVPLNGQGGLGAISPTERSGNCVIQVITGSAATTGSEVPPSPTGGWVPLYLIDLAYGQTAITTAQILTAGPSVGTGVPNNYPYAPFLAGLLQSHHSGNPGQAPKVNLATEVQGTLPVANQQHGQQSYTAAGTYTFTIPAGVTAVTAECWGGGSGSPAGYSPSSYASGGGGGGGYSRKYVSGLTPGGTVTVTVGAAGAAGTTSVLPTGGGTSSFGAYCSASGGVVNGTLTLTNPTLSNVPGIGTGGDVNFQGSWGAPPFATINGAGNQGGNGGAAAMGGGGGSGNVGVGTAGGFPGGGGGGVGPSITTGQPGGVGCVSIRW